MHYGLSYFPTAESMRPADLARAAEARGFESVWFAEHSHIPESPATPGPPQPGEPGLPREYYAVADPFVGLAMAAAATTKLRIGTGICLVPQRDVFQTAKEVASLDLFSGGRFEFGIGGGWNRPEIADHGTDPDVRFAVMRERIEAMKRLWADEKAEYHGRHVDFGPCYAWPKPLQQPHPPIHVGGVGMGGIRRAVRYGDGWIPVLGGDDDPIALLPKLREALVEAGRDADSFPVTIYFCPPDVDIVARCRGAGIARVLFPTPSRTAAELEGVLDGYAKLIS
jgi:probable F420-dependent oxidoreductase